MSGFKTLIIFMLFISSAIVFNCSSSGDESGNSSKDASSNKDGGIPGLCTPGEISTCTTYYDYKVCNESGTGYEVKSC
ncbi:MAG: hypothetical protein ACPL7I_10805, partial [Myxococcota bacterium]